MDLSPRWVSLTEQATTGWPQGNAGLLHRALVEPQALVEAWNWTKQTNWLSSSSSKLSFQRPSSLFQFVYRPRYLQPCLVFSNYTPTMSASLISFWRSAKPSSTAFLAAVNAGDSGTFSSCSWATSSSTESFSLKRCCSSLPFSGRIRTARAWISLRLSP